MLNDTIHYLWVGPPTKNDLQAIPGHDVLGPIKMAKVLKEQKGDNANKVVFWCFAEFKEDYERQFKEAGVPIKTCAIEHLLKEELAKSLLSAKAQYVCDFIQKNKVSPQSSTITKVELKDLFSLFLLVSQGGYFFDTNVFPQKDARIDLPGEPVVTTARSGFQNTNDFYMMYSPKRAFPRMLQVFDRWCENPNLGNLNAFADTKAPIPFFTREMGVKKMSYKSYFGNGERGLFYWLTKTNDKVAIDYFAESLSYGDINEKRTYPQNISPLKKCSLVYLDKTPTLPNLLELAFPTPTAYVRTADWEMYYVDKTTQTATLVYQSPGGIFDIFPSSYSLHKVKPLQPAIFHDLLHVLENQKEDHQSMVSAAKEYYPPYLVNKENCTLLHQAVLTQNAAQVRILLQANARQDLKATYELKPSGETLELTAKELAHYLELDDMLSLFAENTPKEPELNPPSPVQEKSKKHHWRFFKKAQDIATLEILKKPRLDHSLPCKPVPPHDKRVMPS